MNYPHDVKPIFESFTSAGPTRPDDCLCLPGYVPSKTKDDTFGGTIIQRHNKIGTLYFLPSGTRTAYWIPSCTTQGINHNFCSDPMKRTLTAQEWSAMVDTFDKTLTKTIWDELHATITTSAFFCQRLTDATDVKPCTRLH